MSGIPHISSGFQTFYIDCPIKCALWYGKDMTKFDPNKQK